MRLKALLRSALTLGAVTTALVTGAAAAQAAPGDGLTWKNYQTGRCLDGNLVDSTMFTNPCQGQYSQDWQFVPISGGYIHVVNDLATGMNRCMTTNGTTVWRVYCGHNPSGSSQRWTLIDTSYGLMFKSDDGKCLESSSTGGVYMRACNSANKAQSWH
ncbi:hypothetical protein GCM10009839_32510 [Catenulispora yoronensis]|uniref:Ricin B lectin domain-containing protein n=1 Tax=Catenulispora yoronensis TaxID=450799 RepID=A0ABN2U7J2_9ACTN